jgi:HEAT repeat protein
MYDFSRDLEHEAGSVRRVAIEVLGRIEDPRTIPHLVTALDDPDSTVRVSAVNALSRVRTEPAITELLKRALHDPVGCVRLTAAENLAASGLPGLETHFLDRLVDQHFEVRLTAVRFLGKTRNSAYVQPLLKMLDDPDHDVREAAALALGDLEASAAIEPLVLALCDEDQAVRKAAEAALRKIDVNWARSEHARRAGEQLGERLQSRPAWVRAAIGHLLVQLRGGDPSATRLCTLV